MGDGGLGLTKDVKEEGGCWKWKIGNGNGRRSAKEIGKSSVERELRSEETI
jgi:hypothetical protein